MVNCPNFLSWYYAAIFQPSQRMDQYTDVISKVSKIFGYDITQTPIFVWVLYDLFTSMVNIL